MGPSHGLGGRERPRRGGVANGGRELEGGRPGRRHRRDVRVRAAQRQLPQHERVADRGPAREADLYRPFGIAFSPEGDMYISDSFNHRIRRVWRGWSTRGAM